MTVLFPQQGIPQPFKAAAASPMALTRIYKIMPPFKCQNKCELRLLGLNQSNIPQNRNVLRAGCLISSQFGHFYC